MNLCLKSAQAKIRELSNERNACDHEIGLVKRDICEGEEKLRMGRLGWNDMLSRVKYAEERANGAEKRIEEAEKTALDADGTE